VFKGYRPPASNEGVLLADGWLNTGDLARIDADGYVFLAGRQKDLIIRGGHNIDPALIEEALQRHPAVHMAAAVGRPDAYAGELPIAFVALRPGQEASGADLRAFARAAISERAAAPVDVLIVPELPLTAVGKVFKVPLRAIAVASAFEAALRDHDIEASVTVTNDTSQGTLALVRPALRSQAGAIATILDRFPVPHRICAGNSESPPERQLVS
jgi:fatty-acyl-CoA synthase